MSENDSTQAQTDIERNADSPHTQNAGNVSEAQPELTDDAVKKALDVATELKQEGNDHFRTQDWNAALAAYRSALGRLPKRPSPPKLAEQDKGKERDVDEDEDAPPPEPAAAAPTATSADSPLPTFSAELQTECGKARAILNANIAACYVKLGEHKDAVAACTQALLDDPTYVKALQRRAACNEELDTWSSLTSAQEDYTKLLELLPPSSPQVTETRRKLHALKPRVEAAQKRETSEMLGKLKDLGNTFLGNFGLSTDNFKFEPNGQGGYSMNFTR
ncbi:TPR-like protein [Phanerochaete sordida]|uniref:TPR-like protein n=1 Tax=Phanerochaete sordida TaxID=48140 RepID=A0A9P3FYV8_9APHY|nr:TPR-like protein [Phanerochaete sordida]